MHILIIGAAGMLGRKITSAILADPTIGGRTVTALSLVDLIAPQAPDWPTGRVSARAADLGGYAAPAELIEGRPEVIIHLAAVVSADAEVHFDKGYRVNVDGTRALLEAVRHAGDAYRPRLVFASSLAVFGPPFPNRIPDDFAPAPRTSYGTQKVIAELLINDYSRKGMIDGVSLRLPTISIRPGKPNAAASGFFSGIIREPLIGQPAALPVPDTTRHWHASPRSAAGFFLHAAGMDTASLGHRRALNMPGLSTTVAEQIEALRAVAGQGAIDLIRPAPDPLVANIVGGWGGNYEASRARALGFITEGSFEDIIKVHIEDELGGALPGPAAN
ncbi:MAG: D-erythronate dehydrogenase [Pseudomonadota bacterium]